MFREISNKADFSQVERDTLEFWEKHRIFQKSMSRERASSEYVFYDGPPFATGLPHYGHLLAGTIKDVVPRYQAMKGAFVERRFGWDCHGLPVEYEVEQALNISGKRQIEELGVAKFNESCRSIVLRYTREWREIITRMGRWVDFDRDYKTMDTDYMESIWWVFKALWDRGYVYEGNKILPYCPRCATPLSNFETNQGYADVDDPAITVRFRLTDEENAYILAWTTTPWTLPSNMGLAVSADTVYMRVKEKNVVYYLAKSRMDGYYKKPEDYESATEVSGKDLAGRTYEPLFPYFAHMKEKGAFRIHTAGFVTTEDGTGVVHIAPAFGEDDYNLAQSAGIPVVCPVDDEGLFTDKVPDFAGRGVKEADRDIIERLKKDKLLVHRSQIRHSYPHCWRCDTALIYRAVSTWFVSVEKIKERLIEANKTVHWMPEHLRDGRFGKWLEGARDWAVSRNRYWGAPIPVWKNENGTETLCIGSRAELEKLSGCKVEDLHKHIVDGIEFSSPSGNGRMKRVPEVLDCWFESGAMPYAQAHYPFENKEHFESNFPADFIAEGLDQTRGWFYTLMVLSVALFDKPAFRNVVVNGLVLAGDGRKMSKRLKNYPDPVYMLDTYGADALRLYLLSSPVVRGEDLCFSEEGVKQVMRHILIPIWNVYSFFVTYANIDGWSPAKEEAALTSINVLDVWIISALDGLAEKVGSAMDAYDLQGAVRPFLKFVDDLTNWYVRRSRRRFWKSQDDEDKTQAYKTLHHVLLTLSRISAPFIPFISEEIYRNLSGGEGQESVHLTQFPSADPAVRNAGLEEQMEKVMAIVRLGRQLRADHDLKVRQPLQSLHVVSRDKRVLEAAGLMSDIITDELNIKEVMLGDQESELANLSAKANFKKLGPRYGQLMKKIASEVAAMAHEEIEQLAGGKSVDLSVEGQDVRLESDDIVIERTPKEGLVVSAEGAILVALDTRLSDDLVLEGLAREFVNKVQNMRKTSEFNVTQRIRIVYESESALLRDALKRHSDYISAETLALEISETNIDDKSAAFWDVNGHECRIFLSTANQGLVRHEL